MKLSVVIPFLNENENISRIYQELLAAHYDSFADVELEILFMDNHSTDNSFAIAAEICQRDPRAKVIRLTRNFGYQANIYTGFTLATGDAIVQLDADGEDDPRLISHFLAQWRDGYQVVYGVRLKRVESGILTMARKAFYRLLRSCSEIDIPLDAGDFRLIDRKVVDALKGFKESSLYLRGLISYIGYRQIGVPYQRRPRYRGISKFSLIDYFVLAMDGITSFSKKPLTFVTLAGFILSLVGFVGILVYAALFFAGKISQPGFTTMILVILAASGVQLFSLGLIGIYIGRIFEEVKGRPRALIEAQFPPAHPHEIYPESPTL